MADQIEINIYMRDGASANAGTQAQDNTGNGSNIEGMSQTANTQSGDTKNKTVKLEAVGKYIASQTIEVFLNNAKSVISQNIGLVTGKTELQQRVNFTMETVQQGVNTYKNAMAGKILFQSAGLSGGLGAVVGAALSVVSYGINLAFKQSQLNVQEGLENRQIQQVRSRAGAGFNRSREGY